ncbi:hypothetical protein [Haloquadratum walsbyi]|uniref:hypothetical protein n=1 Tax=Haloquadratum walsbyi TaxID=293091 RepID=UPI000323D7CE|nr:hypothetical protein [Haloquadratum walsbyi]
MSIGRESFRAVACDIDVVVPSVQFNGTNRCVLPSIDRADHPYGHPTHIIVTSEIVDWVLCFRMHDGYTHTCTYSL